MARLLWGSDWPHTMFAVDYAVDYAVDDAATIAPVRAALGEPAWDRIRSVAPAERYA